MLADRQTDRDEQTFIPDVGYPEICNSCLHFLQTISAISKMRYDLIIDKHQHMHFCTFKTVLV